MTITYEEAWEDVKRWLENGCNYLEKRRTELSMMESHYFQLECKRIEGKLDGIKTCINHMNESEKIYHLKEEE